jgi:hypothetical protein
MPGRDFYRGLSLAETLRRLAEHHYDPENRHISKHEYEVLLRAANKIEAGQKSPDRRSSDHDN